MCFIIVNTVLFSTALFFCFAAQFLRSLRTNPGANPPDTKDAGNHDPGRAKFCPLRPRPAGPETARTAGRSGRAGAFTTLALSPAFLSSPALRFDRGPTAAQICLKMRSGVAPCPAHNRPTQPLTEANRRDTAGAAFSFG